MFACVLRIENTKVMFLGLLLALAGGLGYGCRHEEGTGKIICHEPVYDAGRVREPRLTHVFQITNDSLVPCKIIELVKSCRCVLPEVPRLTIPPGAKIDVPVTVDIIPETGLRHKRRKIFQSVVVHFDAPFLTPLPLVIRGEFVPVICVSEDRLRATVDEVRGRVVNARFDIVVNAGGVSEDALRIQAEGIDLDVQVEHVGPPERDGVQRCLVTMKGAIPADRMLPLEADLVVSLRDNPSSEQKIPLRLSSTASADITNLTSRVALGVVAAHEGIAGCASAKWSSAADYKVQSIDCPSWMKCTARMSMAGESCVLDIDYEITAPDEPGVLLGTLAVVVANPFSRRTIEWPISGMVK